MLFNSLDFAIFLPIVFLLYWFATSKSLKLQNLLMVSASYLFYGWWDWRFLSLIVFSTIIDYIVALKLATSSTANKRKLLLWISICVNLGFLGFFKYYNFFLDNFISAFSFFGLDISANTLNIILPVGISFYTFQTLSYTIDVYKRKLEPTKDLISFALYVSFFPQLVAGPIERATELLPQFIKKREFNYKHATDGLRQILWGLFKKIVIADSCAIHANEIFNNSGEYSGSTLVVGALFFALQIYGDFSGYSDIAIGTARLFGIRLRQNFAFPYFSRDIAEFWRRWHISLSTWFRDYLYIPLGGSRRGNWINIRNIFIIFIVSGFWHGANWTFIVWGALNAIYFLPLFITKRNRNNLDIVASKSLLPSVKEMFLMLGTFALTLIAWVFFRAETVTHAMNYLINMFNTELFVFPEFQNDSTVKPLLLALLAFVAIEWFGRHGKHALEFLAIRWPKIVRYAFYISIAFVIILFSGKAEQDFIYFQF